jgi:hypothetical protein
MKLMVPWKSGDPGLGMMLMRPRPGLLNSAD